MKYILFCLFLLLGACDDIKPLNQTFVNAIHLKDINLTEKDIEHGNVLNFYYTNNRLYISDNVHKKIFALNSYNRVVFELGNIFDTSTTKQNDSEAWTSILEELQTDFKTSKQLDQSPHNKSENTNKNDFTIKVNYNFSNIGKIAIDHEGNIYVISYENDNNSSENRSELLKFSSKGTFLYRIGEEGRDNPAFQSDINIQNFYCDTDNGLWIKYLQNGKIGLRYYSSFGKNILYFSEDKIVPMIEGYLEQNQGLSKYSIEDIFPVNNSRNIIIILDIYKEIDGQLKIDKKQILTVDKRYILKDITPINNLNIQMYGITNNNQLYGFSYQDKIGYILEVYNLDGNVELKSKFNPEINYYTRLYLGVNPDGGFLGLFLKSKDLVFATWRI